MLKEMLKMQLITGKKKGEFEKTEDFYKRVNEQTRSEKIVQFTEIAINYLKPKYKSRFYSNSFSLGEYDADNETFIIKPSSFKEFAIKIPIEIAPSFKSNWSFVEFKDVEFNIKDDQFVIAKVEIYNRKMQKRFSYNSKEPISYSLNNYSYNFSPIEINIDNEKNTNLTILQNQNLDIGKSDVDINIPSIAKEDPLYFAVVIGNEIYTKEIKVKYALNDARLFKEYLKKTLGFPINNIHYIENATYGQILDALEWIKEVIKAYNGQAKVIFYYAGHGMPDEKTKSAFLLPVDGNSQNFGTAVMLSDVYSKLAEFPSASVTVFLDACFSGSTRETDGTMLADGRGVKIQPRNDILPGDLIVFSATTGDETALPYREKQHGMFTYFLLKKIQDTKGKVTLNELTNYVINHVTQQSLVVNKKSQTPQLNTSSQVQNIWQTIKLR